MTPPTIILLHAALVFSVFDIASQDDKNWPVPKFLINHKTGYHNEIHYRFPINMETRTNLDESEKVIVYNPKNNIEINGDNHIYSKHYNHKIGVNKMRHFIGSTGDTRYVSKHKRVRRQDYDAKCDNFLYTRGKTQIMHPAGENSNYAPKMDCETIISAEVGNIITLDFVDMFHIEHDPKCAYDFLEIRDGRHGYSQLINKSCGDTFPPRIKSSGPYLWLKFHSDDTIEYEGFKIDIKIESSSISRLIPDACYVSANGRHGIIGTALIPEECKTQSKEYPLDVLWKIHTPSNTKIHLDFIDYQLQFTNDCTKNFIQIFSERTDMDSEIATYCGSIANSQTTKGDGGDESGNLMYVRLYLAKDAKEKSKFNATYTAFRIINSKLNESCKADEFDCEDNTCVALNLRCDGHAHCRLKSDEDERCKGVEQSMIGQTHILIILVIFSLILSGMSFVFLFKCIRKLVQDHKAIKDHIQQSCEERLDILDTVLESRHSRSHSEQRASSDKDNRANELYKRQRNLTQRQPTSIDSDFIQETHIDIDQEPWRREVESLPIDPEDIRIERNGRSRRHDLSRKEESMRKENRTRQNEEANREQKEIRDVSVGAPDTKETGCQTRESLFQAGIASSDGTESESGARGFSTFGYSGATLARPSPAPPVESSHITIELLRTLPTHQDTQSKKLSDRRPMSAETTRSAPDVIIVSKPIG